MGAELRHPWELQSTGGDATVVSPAFCGAPWALPCAGDTAAPAASGEPFSRNPWRLKALSKSVHQLGPTYRVGKLPDSNEFYAVIAWLVMA